MTTVLLLQRLLTFNLRQTVYSNEFLCLGDHNIETDNLRSKNIVITLNAKN
jgi:hypothetical protein